jgi:dTDP-glucose 4,6-dehydratase
MFMSDNTHLLLTGADGFVGSHILEHVLETTDWDVTVICSWKQMGVAERVALVREGREDRVRVYTHDLRAPLSDVLIDWIGEVDYVINCASESHVDRSITDPGQFIKNNVDLVINMLEYARVAMPCAFIQISTDEVYGPAPGDTRHAEWSPIMPSNPYSASKACQEAIAYSYWRTYDVPVIVTNTMNIIGERQDPEKYVPMIIRSVLDGETLTVHGSKEAIGSRFYLHARNQADALIRLLNHGAETHHLDGEPMARYNVVGEIELNNLELAQMIADHIGKPLNYELVDFHSTRPGHDLRYALDGSRIEEEFGWTPPVPFKESLERTVDWYIAHPEWLRRNR